MTGGVVLFYSMSCASPTRGIFTGGSPDMRAEIEYLTISTLGNTADFGNTSDGHAGGQGCSNAIRGIFGGGYAPGVSNIIDFITIATLGNATDFGDLTAAKRGIGAAASKTRAVFAGGGNPSTSAYNVIEYVQIMSTGNVIDFGDLTGSNSGAKRNVSGCSNGHGGLF